MECLPSAPPLSFKTVEHFLAALVVGAVEPRRLSQTECNRLVETARQHGVAPMLYWQLRRMGADLTSPEWQGLNTEHQNQIRRYLELKVEFQAIESALTAAGIPSIWLKGFALAHTVYPNVGLRPMRDLDALVPFAQREEALARMEEIGFVQTIIRPSSAAQELYHDYHLVRNVPFELHYRLLGVHTKFFTHEYLEWFWTQTHRVRRSGLALTALTPEAMLLHLCAHSILSHGQPEFLLQRYLDLHLLISNSSELDWQRVVQHAIELRWTYAVARALEITHEYFATPIPETLLSELAALRPADENSARAFHNRTNATPSETTLNYLRGMKHREKLLWVAASLFPSTEFMRWRYRVQARWQLPLFYAYRWGGIARELLQQIKKRMDLLKMRRLAKKDNELTHLSRE